MLKEHKCLLILGNPCQLTLMVPITSLFVLKTHWQPRIQPFGEGLTYTQACAIYVK